jgi:hypothetical protein
MLMVDMSDFEDAPVVSGWFGVLNDARSGLG